MGRPAVSTASSTSGTSPRASTPVWCGTSATCARRSSSSATSGARRSASARAAARSRTRTSCTRSGAKRRACLTQCSPSSGTGRRPVRPCRWTGRPGELGLDLQPGHRRPRRSLGLGDVEQPAAQPQGVVVGQAERLQPGAPVGDVGRHLRAAELLLQPAQVGHQQLEGAVGGGLLRTAPPVTGRPAVQRHPHRAEGDGRHRRQQHPQQDAHGSSTRRALPGSLLSSMTTSPCDR